MLVWIVGLAQCLLPCCLVHATVHRILVHARATESRLSKLPIRTIHSTAIINPLLLLLRAFLEEDLPEHIFLLLVRVIVLDIVVVWLVKHAIRIMIAVGILVSNSTRLTQR